MKTDSQRQIEYQARRREQESRITIWVSNELIERIDAQRNDESRTDWMIGAILMKLART